MHRRELLKFFAAGGLIVGGELWMPGKKLISLPSKLTIEAYPSWFGGLAPEYIGPVELTEEALLNMLRDTYDKGGRPDKVIYTGPPEKLDEFKAYVNSIEMRLAVLSEPKAKE